MAMKHCSMAKKKDINPILLYIEIQLRIFVESAMIKTSKFNTPITVRPVSTRGLIFATRANTIKPAMIMIVVVKVTVNHNFLNFLIELKFFDFVIMTNYLSCNRATVVFFNCFLSLNSSKIIL